MPSGFSLSRSHLLFNRLHSAVHVLTGLLVKYAIRRAVRVILDACNERTIEKTIHINIYRGFPLNTTYTVPVKIKFP